MRLLLLAALVWTLLGCEQRNDTPLYEFPGGTADTGGVPAEDAFEPVDVETTGGGTTNGDDAATTNTTGGDTTTEEDVVEPPPDVWAAVGDFVGRLLADPALNGYYLNQDMDLVRLKSCLVAMVEAPAEYPSPGCRSIKAAHDGLGISQADVDDWVMHLQVTLGDHGFDAATASGSSGRKCST